jgi:integrase
MTDNSQVKLTKRVVDAAEPKAKPYDLWDGELSGFGLRVGTSGTKTFIIRYRANGGGRNAPRRFMVVGRHGTLSADQARTNARKLLASATSGADPAAERSNKRKEMTIAELLERYAHEGTDNLKPLTKTYTLARLRNHVLPLLGSRKVTEITTGDVEGMGRAIANGKTRKDEKVGVRARVIVRGGGGAAAKVVRDLSAVFTFAKRHNIVTTNPCEGAHRRADDARDVFLSDEQLGRLGSALEQVAADGANAMAVNIIRLLAVTGCRRNEIAGLRWSEVDFDHACLRLADSKTGKSTRQLGESALAVLHSLTHSDDSEYVFPASTGTSHYQGIKRVWKRVCEIAELSNVTLHTLRHTLASSAVSNGETLAMTGALLGHSNARSTSRYAHIAHNPAKQAMDRVSKHVDDAMRGTSPPSVR